MNDEKIEEMSLDENNDVEETLDVNFGEKSYNDFNEVDRLIDEVTSLTNKIQEKSILLQKKQDYNNFQSTDSGISKINNNFNEMKVPDLTQPVTDYNVFSPSNGVNNNQIENENVSSISNVEIQTPDLTQPVTDYNAFNPSNDLNNNQMKQENVSSVTNLETGAPDLTQSVTNYGTSSQANVVVENSSDQKNQYSNSNLVEKNGNNSVDAYLYIDKYNDNMLIHKNKEDNDPSGSKASITFFVIVLVVVLLSLFLFPHIVNFS